VRLKLKIVQNVNYIAKMTERKSLVGQIAYVWSDWVARGVNNELDQKKSDHVCNSIPSTV
jgi:hypothetical protein